MTGGEAAFGRQMKNGAEQFVADFNAGPGLMGKKLKLEVGDDACDPKQARSVAEKLAGMKVPFVAGHFCSSSSIPASEVYSESGVLQITPASTNPLLHRAQARQRVCASAAVTTSRAWLPPTTSPRTSRARTSPS